MTMDLLSRKQFEDAAAGDADAGVRAHVQASRTETHTSMPGIVKSFDAAKQTAVVQPAIERFFRGEGFKPLPRLFDVPVIFPRGGGFVLTFPVKQGDECLLVFAERAIDNWHAKGGVRQPSEFRSHDLSDACALVGLSSIPSAVDGFSSSAVELRSLDGKAKVSIDNNGNINAQSESGDIQVASTSGKITLNVPGGASAAVQMVTGVLTGSLMCPILKATHGSFSGGIGCSARVHAGST